MSVIKEIFMMFLIVCAAVVNGCRGLVNSEYIVEKKYPSAIPLMRMRFLSDSTGIIRNEESTETQKFNFKSGKHFLVITSVSEPFGLGSIRSGDTIVWYKKTLYYFNDRHKLVLKNISQRNESGDALKRKSKYPQNPQRR